MRGEHGVGRRAGEVMHCAVATERPNLRIALAAEFCLHDWYDDAEVESIGHSISDVHRRDSDIEIHRQVEIHGVVLETRDPVQSAVAAELRVASGEVDVLMGEDEIDVSHVDAAQRRKAKPGSADSGQHSSATESLCSLGEYRS